MSVLKNVRTYFAMFTYSPFGGARIFSDDRPLVTLVKIGVPSGRSQVGVPQGIGAGGVVRFLDSPEGAPSARTHAPTAKRDRMTNP